VAKVPGNVVVKTSGYGIQYFNAKLINHLRKQFQRSFNIFYR